MQYTISCPYIYKFWMDIEEILILHVNNIHKVYPLAIVAIRVDTNID